MLSGGGLFLSKKDSMPTKYLNCIKIFMLEIFK